MLVLQGCILGSTLFLLHIAICSNKTTIYFKCDKASHLLKELDVSFELQSDLQNTVDWGKK